MRTIVMLTALLLVAGWASALAAGAEGPTCSPALVPLRGLCAQGGLRCGGRTVGGVAADTATAIAVTPNGDVVVAGNTNSFGAGAQDLLVVRLEGASGSVVWARTWGGPGSDIGAGVTVAPNLNGDVLVTGYTQSIGAGGYDVFVLRLDGGNGSLVWARTWGGSGAEQGAAITLAPNGDVLLTGSVFSFGAGDRDVFLVRLDGANGTVLWSRAWGGSLADQGSGVAVAPNGDVVVTGVTRLGAGSDDVAVLRFDGGNGSLVWARTWGGSLPDQGLAVAVGSNGDVVVTGVTQSFGAGSFDVLVLRLDGGSGSLVWARTWGGSSPEYGYAIVLAPNGDALVTGATNSFGAGGNDAFALRVDAGNGSVVWAHTCGGSSNDLSYAIGVTPNGDVVVAGNTNSFGAGVQDLLVLVAGHGADFGLSTGMMGSQVKVASPTSATSLGSSGLNATAAVVQGNSSTGSIQTAVATLPSSDVSSGLTALPIALQVAPVAAAVLVRAMVGLVLFANASL